MTLQEAYDAHQVRELITIKRKGGAETYTLQYFTDEYVDLIGDYRGRSLHVKRDVFDRDWTITLEEN